MANIIGFARTPFVPILGAFAQESSMSLGITAVKGAFSKGIVKANAIDTLVLSQVITGGTGPSPSRQISKGAGLPYTTKCMQINHLCTSGLKGVTIATDGIALGKSQLTAVVGVESSSQSPYLLTKAREGGYGLGDGVLVDSLTNDGFSTPCMDLDTFLKHVKITNAELSQYVQDMFQQTAACYSDGIMQNEIIPVMVNRKNNHKYGGLWISPPQQKVSEDILPKLHNPKSLSGTNIKTKATLADGAACLLLANDDFVNRLGISPYARILSYCEESVDGSQFPKALVGVIKKIIAEVNHRVDLYDIMDQYALLSVYASRNLDIDHSRINTNGSTIAIGHPMGATGIRQIISLVSALRARQLRYGCVAGTNLSGDAIAMLVEVC